MWVPMRTAKRVEVPFSAAAPGPEQFWTLSAQAGIRVPLGRTGADRLQHLDLGKGTADYGLRARIFEKPELMGDATADEIDDLTKAVIPLRISGSLASPKVAPDVEEMLKEQVEEEIKEKLEDKLKDIFKR